jgi:small-conductance mechanosensitive channel
MKKPITEWINSITPWLLDHGIKILAIGVIAFILMRIVDRLIERAVRATIVSDDLLSPIAETKREDTLIRIFSGVAKITILLMSALMILQEMGLMIGPILAGAGIAGLAVGFGGQYLIRDVISGMFIILENQYRIGDVVNFDGTGGLVEDISLRMTTIRDLDGTVHHIPHGEIKKIIYCLSINIYYICP